jgi:hypothetical protein
MDKQKAMTDTIYRLLVEYHAGDGGVKVETPSTDTIVVSEGKDKYIIDVSHQAGMPKSQTQLGSTIGGWVNGVPLPPISSAEQRMWRQNQTVAINMYRERCGDKYTVEQAFELFDYIFNVR